MTHLNNRYPGGKGSDGTYQQIINLIPPHKVYVSPFAGKDAIYRNIQPSGIAILNDVDAAIVNYWKHYLKSFPEIVVYEDYIQGTIFSDGDDKKCKVILRNNNAFYIIQKFMHDQNTFIYCDPPYPLMTRKSKKQLYAFEFTEPDEHRKLLTLLLSATCNIMISTYENQLYNEYLIDPGNNNIRTWQKHSFNVQTRQGMATETVYFNYMPPVILHDFQYLGSDYRERERIKRKVKRFQERMKTLPPAERNAILSAAARDYNDTINTIIHL